MRSGDVPQRKEIPRFPHTFQPVPVLSAGGLSLSGAWVKRCEDANENNIFSFCYHRQKGLALKHPDPRPFTENSPFFYTIMKAALLVALLCVVGAEAKGYGTRSYSTPSKKKSKAWKYAAFGAGGFVAGAGAYYIGSKLYDVHTRYQYIHYNSYYNSRSSSWRNSNPKRATGCTPTGGLREDSTNAWVIAQIVINKNRTDFIPAEVEVDLFNELLFRSPCKTPTQIVALALCVVQRSRALTASDRSNPGVCQTLGDVESLPEEHAAAKRKLLATSDKFVMEVAVGADDIFAAGDVVCIFIRNRLILPLCDMIETSWRQLSRQKKRPTMCTVASFCEHIHIPTPHPSMYS